MAILAALFAFGSRFVGKILRFSGTALLAHLLPPTLNRMCRNIRTLHNFEPPATDEEVHDDGADDELGVAEARSEDAP